MYILLALFFISIDFIPIYKKNEITDCHCEPFLFGFVFPPPPHTHFFFFFGLWKMWKIIDGQEWGEVERFGLVTINTPKQSLHYVQICT